MTSKLLFFTLILFWIAPVISFAQSCDNWLKENKEILGMEMRDLAISKNQLTIEALINRATANPTFYARADIIPKYNGTGDANPLIRPIVTQMKTANGFLETKPTHSYLTNVVANFTGPDTVCINTPVQFTNTSVGASNYYWSFCQADINQKPTGQNLGDMNSAFFLPDYSDIVSQNGNYYVFVINNHPGGIIRLDFGNSMLNTPTVVELGNINGMIKDQAEGVQIINIGNHWYGIVVGGNEFDGNPPYIMKLDFGSDIKNTTPSVTDWGNMGNLSYPHKLYVFNSNNKWYGFTANFNNSTITRFDFGTDFSGVPVATNLGNFGVLNGATGLNAVEYNNNWYVFVTNAIGNKITRLNFGASLLNTPTAIDIGNVGGMMQGCFDIYIQKYCDQIIGFVVNGDDNYNDIVHLDFNNDIESIPSAYSLGNIGNLSFPHSFSKLFRVENDLYTIIPNAHNNTLTRLRFSGCSNSSIAGTTQANPPKIIYDKAGVYNINLSVDEGLPTQTSFCKQIVVVNCDTLCSLKAGFKYAQESCSPNSIHFQSNTSNADNIWWDFGNGVTAGNITDTIINYTSFGNYAVKLFAKTNKGCLDTTEYTVNVSILEDDAIINNDTSICASDSVQLNAVNGLDYCWFPAAGLSNTSIKNPVANPFITTKYYLHVLTDSSKPVLMDSVIITVLPLPDIKVSDDTIVCGNALVQLNANGASSYTWNPSAGLSNTTIANPIAEVSSTTTYVATGIANNSCTAQDSVTITVNPIPAFAVNPQDTSVCLGDSIILTASGGDIYKWQPGEYISDPSSAAPTIIPVSDIIYSVIVTNSVCKMSDTLNTSIIVNEVPNVTLAKSNDVDCLTPQATLTARGGVQYTWKPATFISNMYINNPVVTPPSDTWYSVNVKDQNGCKSSDSILVKSSFAVGSLPFQVPGAFTPNNDGLNDCFSLKNWGPVDYFDILIYDRWGYLVFHSSNINSCWDGAVKGVPQGAGTFVYQVKVSSKCTEGVVMKKGTLVLIR